MKRTPGCSTSSPPFSGPFNSPEEIRLVVGGGYSNDGRIGFGIISAGDGVHCDSGKVNGDSSYLAFTGGDVGGDGGGDDGGENGGDGGADHGGDGEDGVDWGGDGGGEGGGDGGGTWSRLLFADSDCHEIHAKIRGI